MPFGVCQQVETHASGSCFFMAVHTLGHLRKTRHIWHSPRSLQKEPASLSSQSITAWPQSTNAQQLSRTQLLL